MNFLFRWILPNILLSLKLVHPLKVSTTYLYTSTQRMSNPWTVSRAASAATAAEDKDSVAKKKPNLMEIMDEQLALSHMQQFEADITYGERDNAAGGSLSPSSCPAAPVAAILDCENTVSIAGDPASDVITKNEQMELDESLLLAMVLQQIEEEEQAEAVAQSHAYQLQPCRVAVHSSAWSEGAAAQLQEMEESIAGTTSNDSREMQRKRRNQLYKLDPVLCSMSKSAHLSEMKGVGDMIGEGLLVDETTATAIRQMSNRMEKHDQIRPSHVRADKKQYQKLQQQRQQNKKQLQSSRKAQTADTSSTVDSATTTTATIVP